MLISMFKLFIYERCNFNIGHFCFNLASIIWRKKEIKWNSNLSANLHVWNVVGGEYVSTLQPLSHSTGITISNIPLVQTFTTYYFYRITKYKQEVLLHCATNSHVNDLLNITILTSSSHGSMYCPYPHNLRYHLFPLYHILYSS